MLDQKLVLWVWNVDLLLVLGAIYPMCHPISKTIMWPASTLLYFKHVDWSMLMKNNAYILSLLQPPRAVLLSPSPFSYHSTFYHSFTFMRSSNSPTSFHTILHPVLTVPRQHCQYSISSAWGLQSRQRPGVLQPSAGGGWWWRASSEQHCYTLPQGLCVSEEH